MAHSVKPRKRASVLYLYGISLPSDFVLPSIIGLDGHAPVETLTCGPFTCWISRVAAAFTGDFSARMQDLDWLAEVTQRHHAATAAIAERADILPARFGTVFLNEASLCKSVSAQAAHLRSDLKRIKGNQEWGVKVFAVPQESVVDARPRTGRAYLQAKSAGMRKTLSRKPDQAIEKLAHSLRRLSVATADGGKIGGGRKDLEFQMAILVQRSNRRKLESLLGRFAEKWKQKHTIECTGPWPPYSFVSGMAQK